MKLKLFTFTLLSLLLASCTIQPLPELDEREGKLVTINVTVSPETRVAYNDANLSLAWENEDQLLLAGYNGDTYIGSEIFTYTGTNNYFSGHEVYGATTYKAYYPATITLDANGNVQPLGDAFWQQTQNGDGNTSHLKNKLLLFDEIANPLDNTFKLEMKNSIIKFYINHLDKDIGRLIKLIWTVEIAPGVPKSMMLSLTNSEVSDKNSFYAFLAFDPTVITKAAANGHVRIAMVGSDFTYAMNTAVNNEKLYAAGKRYRANCQPWNKNPLMQVAEYNVKTDGKGFVTDLTACPGDAGGFTFQDAVNRFYNFKNIPGYYLPSIDEWYAIISSNYLTKPCITFSSSTSFYDIIENVKVWGRDISMTSDYKSPGNNITYALRYKGTEYRSAWKYEYIYDDKRENTYMKITSRLVSSSTSLGDIVEDPNFWITNTEDDVVRYFPATGLGGTLLKSVGLSDIFLSRTPSKSNTYIIEFTASHAGYHTSHPQNSPATVRLFANYN